MPAARNHKNLVVVRAGDGSLHERWLGTMRSWDLIVSYFGSDAARFKGEDSLRVDCPGGKWEGLYQLFTSQPHLLETYSYIWLPDDDIDADWTTINKLFATMAEHDLNLAQPSLHPESYFHHHVTLQNPAFRLRYTNFVELMVPCFRADFLRSLVPLFAGRRYGWGIDWVWAYLMEQPSFRTAVIDACAVVHTRPYQVGSLYTQPGAPDPEQEKRELLAQLGVDEDPPNLFAYAALSRQGRPLTARSFTALAKAGGSATALRVYKTPDDRRAFLDYLLENCIRPSHQLEPSSSPF